MLCHCFSRVILPLAAATTNFLPDIGSACTSTEVFPTDTPYLGEACTCTCT